MARGKVPLRDELFVGFQDGVSGEREVAREGTGGGQAFPRAEAAGEYSIADGVGEALVRWPRWIVG